MINSLDSIQKRYKNDLTTVKDIQLLFENDSSFALIPPRFEELNFNELEIIGNIDKSNTLTLFSSGSTGLPKAIVLDKEKIQLNAVQSIEQFNLTTSSKILVVASPWHIAGLTWILAGIISGAEVHFQVPFIDTLTSMHEHIVSLNPTHIFTVPGALRSFHSSNWHVDELIIGGASMDVTDYPHVKQRCTYFTQAYGQTESGGLISSLRKLSNKLVDSDATNVGNTPNWITLLIDNESSEILINSPTAIEPQLHRTGDLGFIKDDKLFITGRIDKSGGNCNALTGITMVAHK